MQRRTLLTALGAALAGAAGCQGSAGGQTTSPSDTDGSTTTTEPPTTTDEPPTTDGPTTETLPSVTAVVGHGGGLSPVASTSYRVERGQVSYRVECRGDDLGPYTVSEPLSDAEYEEFASFVQTLDPESWQSFYECSEDCVVDDGVDFVELTLDGQTYETRLDTEVDPPEGMAQLQERVRDLGERVDGETRPCFRTATTEQES